MKLAFEKQHGRVSESTLRVVEAQCEIVEASYQRLSALAHVEVARERDHVVELLRAAEAALKDLLRSDQA